MDSLDHMMTRCYWLLLSSTGCEDLQGGLWPSHSSPGTARPAGCCEEGAAWCRGKCLLVFTMKTFHHIWDILCYSSLYQTKKYPNNNSWSFWSRFINWTSWMSSLNLSWLALSRKTCLWLWVPKQHLQINFLFFRSLLDILHLYLAMTIML